MATSSVPTFVLEEYAAGKRLLIEAALERYTQAAEPKALWDSMRYSVLSGGKRFRAMLCLASAEAIAGISDRALTFEQAIARAMPCACAIEMVHAMSLIHDDLPCMDNDDFRRGKPTNHKVYGEALALLAGDGLLAYANEILLRQTPCEVPAQTILDVAAELSRATGPAGMVGGQVEDCIATGLMTSPQEEYISADEDKVRLLESIHKKKTGALLRFSAWSGARLMEADKHVLNMVIRYGDILGMAFQIADDLLDITGDIKTLGKTPGKDVATGKVTWVSVYGVEGARKALQDLEEQGNQALLDTGCSEAAIAPLSALLAYAIHRQN